VARSRDISQAVKRWIQDCRSIASRCPERSEMLNRTIPLVPDRDKRASLELLLASGLPDDVTPLLLARLASAIRGAEPERALELDRQLIAHPLFPGLRGYLGSLSTERFERHGDIRSALFLELLRPAPDLRCSRDECNSMRTHAFRVAYYKLLLGMKPAQQWARMMELMPASAATEGAGLFHTHEYLDRFARASRAVHQETATVSWLRELEGRYAEMVQRPDGQTASLYMRSFNTRRTLRELQLTVAGYIDELASPSAGCETRDEPAIDATAAERLTEHNTVAHRNLPTASLAQPGSIEWAMALVDARAAATRLAPTNAKELVASYEPLMALNRDCTTCKRLHPRAHQAPAEKQLQRLGRDRSDRRKVRGHTTRAEPCAPTRGALRRRSHSGAPRNEEHRVCGRAASVG
jgi:hypothetical protein